MLKHAHHVRLAHDRQFRSGRNSVRCSRQAGQWSKRRQRYRQWKAYETGDMQPVIQKLPKDKVPQSYEQDIVEGEVVRPAMQGLGAKYTEVDNQEDIEGIDGSEGFHDEAILDVPPVNQGEDQELEEAIEIEPEPEFHAIELEGCTVLVKIEPDGRFDLRTAYFYDNDLEIYAEPEVIGHLPTTPMYYAPSEWKEDYTGDSLMGKDPWEKIWRMYLVAVADSDPDHFRLDLEQVYVLDAESRTLRKEKVRRLTRETNLQNITLRIRPEGCTIEENSEMISETDLVEAHLAEKESHRIRLAEEESGWTQDGWAPMAEVEGASGPRDPIDALNDDEREYDETFEDTPEVDQGY